MAREASFVFLQKRSRRYLEKGVVWHFFCRNNHKGRLDLSFFYANLRTISRPAGRSNL